MNFLLYGIIFIYFFPLVYSDKIEIYLCQNNCTNIITSELKFSNFFLAYNNVFDTLMENKLILEINFIFTEKYFLITSEQFKNSSKSFNSFNAFRNWEILLERKLTIRFFTLNCNFTENYEFKSVFQIKIINFYIFSTSYLIFSNIIFIANDANLDFKKYIDNPCYNTSEGCCLNENYYTDINSDCFIDFYVRSSFSQRYFIQSIQNSNIELYYTEFKYFLSINQSNYLNSLLRISSGNLLIIGSNFTHNYFKTAFLYSFNQVNITIKKSIFNQYNPYQYYENDYSYIFKINSENSTFLSENNIFHNNSMLILSDKINSVFLNDKYYFFITNTYNLKFSDNLAFFNFFASGNIILFNNCLFYGINDNIQNNELSIISIIYTESFSNLTILNTSFKEIDLKESLLIKMQTYGFIIIKNSIFSQINQNCKEEPSSNCNYPIFYFNDYSNIVIQNISLSEFFIKNSLALFYLGNNNEIIINIISIQYLYFDSFGIYAAVFCLSVQNSITVQNLNIISFQLFKNVEFFSLIAYNHIHVISTTIISKENCISSLLGFAMYGGNIFNFTQIFFDSKNCLNSYGIFFFLQSSIIILTNGTFKNLVGYPSALLFINVDKNTIVMNNLVIDDLMASFGGVVSLGGINNNLLINNTLFLNLNVIQQGGVIYANELNNISIENTFIFNISSNLYGGAIYSITKNNIVLINLKILEVIALSNGGFISLTNFNFINIKDCVFNNSYSTKGQGGLLFSFQNNNINIYNSIFNNISSNQEGGSFFIDNSNILTIVNCKIQNSFTNTEAGFIFAKQINTILIIKCNFKEIYSSFSSGFITSQKSNEIKMKDINMFNIACQKNGGIFYLVDNNNLILEDFYSENISSISGSFIYASIHNNISIIKSNNINFKSILGGVFICYSLNNIQINFTFFKNINSGNLYGAFILTNNNNLNISNSSFYDFSTYGKGALLFLTKENTIFLENNFAFNIAAIGGCSLILADDSNKIYFYSNILKIYNYFGLYCFNFNNNLYFYYNEIVISDAENGDYLLISNENNNFSSFNETIIFNSSLSQISLYFLEKKSMFNFNKTIFKVDKCNKLFIILGNSLFKLHFFFLENFESIDFVFIVDSSEVSLELFYIVNSKVTKLFSIINSKLKMSKTYFFVKIEISLINAINSTLTLKNSVFKNLFDKQLGNIISATNCSINIDIISVHFFNAKFNGSFIIASNSNIKIRKSYFGNNNAENGGVINIFFDDIKYNYSLQIIKCVFFNNKARFKGGSIHLCGNYDSNIFQVSFTKNRFFHNKGILGGSIAIEKSFNISLLKNIFDKNIALINFKGLRSKGGALFLNNIIFLNSIKNKYFNNKAEIGGIFYFNETKELLFIEKKNKIKENKAIYFGDQYASSPTSFRFLSLEKGLNNYDLFFLFDKYNKGAIYSIKSGEKFSNCLLQIHGYDYFNQITYNTDFNFSNYKIIPFNLENQNKFEISQKNGFGCFSSPFYRLKLPLEGEFKYQISYPHFSLDKLYLSLKFKQCDPGDRLTDSMECVPCLPQTYSFQTNFETFSDVCKSCINENFYCFGGNNITVKPGYWRISEDSFIFYRCPNYYACIGDPRNNSNFKTSYINLYSSYNCAEGYKGILCSECEENYGLLEGHICSKCDQSGYYLSVVGNILIRIIFTLYLINVSIKMCYGIMSANPNTKRILATNLLKIFSNHVQIIGIISGLPLSLPNELKFGTFYLMNVSPNVSEAFSIECFLKKLGLEISLQYFKLIFAGIYPILLVFLYLAILYFFNGLSLQIKKLFYKSTPNIKISFPKVSYKERIFTIFSLISLICYSDIAKMTFAMFGCVTIGDENLKKNLLFADLRINCDSEYHKTWIKQAVSPILSFFLFTYPGFIIYKIKKKLHLKTTETIVGIKEDMDYLFYFNYGYFFYAYKKNLFFWDFAILLRKLIFIFINSFYFARINDSIEFYPILFVIIVINISFLFQIYFRPFKNDFKILNHLEELSLIVSSFSLMFTLFYLMANGISSTFIIVLVFVSIILLNCLFFVIWIITYYKYYGKETIGKIFATSRKKNVAIVVEIKKVSIREKKESMIMKKKSLSGIKTYNIK